MKQTTKIEIYDTTLRDGTQGAGVSLSLHDKLVIARALDSLGVDYIEGGYPLSNPKDRAVFPEIRRKKLRCSRLVAFGMTRRKGRTVRGDEGMKALLQSQAPVTAIVGKSWDMHVREVLRADDDENLEMIAQSIAWMVRHDREAMFDAEHFFDGWRANPSYAMSVLHAQRQAGASCLVLCDTNGGSMPEQITQCVRAVREALPDAPLGIHCHNDCGMAVANSLAAVLAGRDTCRAPSTASASGAAIPT